VGLLCQDGADDREDLQNGDMIQLKSQINLTTPLNF